jgi:hypothetical protein
MIWFYWLHLVKQDGILSRHSHTIHEYIVERKSTINEDIIVLDFLIGKTCLIVKILMIFFHSS